MTTVNESQFPGSDPDRDRDRDRGRDRGWDRGRDLYRDRDRRLLRAKKMSANALTPKTPLAPAEKSCH